MTGLFVAMGGVCTWLRSGCVRFYLDNTGDFGRANHWYGNRQWAALRRQNA